jgi:hypothetical protein
MLKLPQVVRVYEFLLLKRQFGHLITHVFRKIIDDLLLEGWTAESRR